MTPRTYEIMASAADAEGNTLFIIVDADTGLSIEPSVGYDTYAEAWEALRDIEEAEERDGPNDYNPPDQDDDDYQRDPTDPDDRTRGDW